MSSSRLVLDRRGRDVVLSPRGGDDLALRAVISDHGFGRAPSGWDEELFPGRARHAAFRFHPDDPASRPSRGDEVALDGETFEIREIFAEPSFGDPAWILCRAAAEQRGTFR